MRKSSLAAGAFALAMAVAAVAPADTVTLTNGDVFTGTIGVISHGSMSFTDAVLGVEIFKLSDVKSFSTSEAVPVRMKTGQVVNSQITSGSADSVTLSNGQTAALADVKDINPPAEKWTGSIVANGALNRGNTNNEAFGFSANATLRRDDFNYNDKFLLGADFNSGTTGRGSSTQTTAENWDASLGYDKYFTDQFYGYGLLGYAHDRIAGLEERLTPGAGVGYQFFESPKFNLSGEAGVTYLYEDYQVSGVDQNIAGRLAYHVDYTLNDKVSVFNDVEWLPTFKDPSDYVLTADAGINAKLTKTFFSQFKVVYRRNDRPPLGFQKDDLAFLLGVGWTF